MIEFSNALRESAAYKLIKGNIKAGNLSHAYMVISPDAYAVKQLFQLIACTVYCKNDACMDCVDCNKVLHNNHADVIHINEQDKQIKVDDVEGIIEDSWVRPYESSHKLYLIYSADKMNAAAQNKMLKTLEEPQPSVTFFLGVQKEAAMLDTVASRAEKLYLDRFPQAVIEAEMMKLTHDAEEAKIAAACSDGMLSRAKSILDGGNYVKIFDRAVEILANLRKSSDVASFLDDKLLNKENMPEFLDILSIIVRDMMTAKSDASLIICKHKSDDIFALAEGYSERALANILYLINSERKKINFYVGAQGVAENLLFGILEVKYKCR